MFCIALPSYITFEFTPSSNQLFFHHSNMKYTFFTLMTAAVATIVADATNPAASSTQTGHTAVRRLGPGVGEVLKAHYKRQR